jgi:YegS/Rv2252/BmrU family lipid kinase
MGVFMKKCVVVINPTSGHGLNEKLAGKISEVLREFRYKSEVHITEYPGHAEEIVEFADCDLLISVGGDGTFYEAMNGNFRRKKQLVLSHIPVGTTNDIGHMYGLGKDIIENLRDILSGVVKKIDICSINGRSFVYVASFGKFMEIPYETPQELKHRFGHAAYLLNGTKALFSKTPKYDVTYEIDGVKHNGKYTFIIISNANRIAGINNFYRDMKLDDHKFEVMFCSISNLAKLAQAFYILKTGDISYINGVECYKTDNLKLTFNDGMKPWCLDGEKYDAKTTFFEIDTNKSVKMLIPKKNVDKLFM